MRKQIGFLFQNAALFDSISVGENVAFPMRRHTQADRPRDPAARAGEARGGRASSSEYDKMPAALSGGMRKRAGLARAMALDPPMLLVDEPSAGLDPITADEIDELLLELKQSDGTTLVVVTHNIPSARRLGDELVMLHEGRIIARGTPRGARASDNELVRAFMTSQTCRLNATYSRAVGAFVIGGLLLFAVGLFLIGDRRMLFADTSRCTPSSRRLPGSKNGAKVRVAGMDAGEVETIQMPGPAVGARFRVRMRVREGPAPAHPPRFGGLDSERRSGRQQVRADRGRHRAVAAGRRRGHDSEPRAVRYR